jgi:crotonobetainyl-CoA:carnitine CoA-transferase CaiB-like acyl-CoA transferase
MVGAADLASYANIGCALDNLLIVEIGSRIAVGVCGNLLAQAGATVVLIEPSTPSAAGAWKWAKRDLFAAGKETLALDTHAESGSSDLSRLIEAADVVLLSSDVDVRSRERIERKAGNALICDFTAFGRDHVGTAPTDAILQSMTGVAFTTGFSGGPPVVLKVPVIEYSAGAYGASAILAAIAAMANGAGHQTIDISLYDCGVNALTTFLPAYFGGSDPGRLGNGHAMAGPWNAYRARDGWVMICSATDPQWSRICTMMQKPELVFDKRFASLGARVGNRQVLDDLVSDWVGRYPISECEQLLTRHEIAHGLILPADEPHSDANLVHRGMVNELVKGSGGTARVPGTLLKAGGGHGRIAANIPENDSFRPKLEQVTKRKKASALREKNFRQPFAGLKVVEIGQYTTAPLVGKHLALLGAEVIKVEPPSGDAARAWLPERHGIGLFFFMNNCGKASVSVDLKKAEGRQSFVQLIQQADVFVENLRPGSMDRLGLGATELNKINPKLIYCQITGFGTDTVYRNKPAYDTVVQAASGFMDANNFEGIPLKAGVSVADFMGGEIGLYAVMAALHQRARVGIGQYIDLSMQDVGSWMSAAVWNGPIDTGLSRLIDCADGYVYAEVAPSEKAHLMAFPARTSETRAAFLSSHRHGGLNMAAVRSVSEVACNEQTLKRDLIVEVANERDERWPALRSPMQLSVTPPSVGGAIGLPQPLLQTATCRRLQAAVDGGDSA